ncbi:hypothetical protein [Sphingobium algorifonticola]|jgi:hypothetical protein|uniref:Uncharacterized protein n=1 Tax=Sphingobium algorifonticola TaxID=2008318 RepID=A0A437J399_9SPHN|nr:hypothetical protein [Sphingobium algorifonticola]RVT38672.1 hypothetical protein ENE74_17445 [Sphingobium algorifonticola]
MKRQLEAALGSDPAIKRALAIVLMREVLPLLDELGEHAAASHLQMAIDTALGPAAFGKIDGSC